VYHQNQWSALRSDVSMDGRMAYKIMGTDRIPDNCGRAHRLYTHGNTAPLKALKYDITWKLGFSRGSGWR